MDILEFINLENKEHIKALKTLFNDGTWPVGFIPDGTIFSTGWYSNLVYKLADAYLKTQDYDKYHV